MTCIFQFCFVLCPLCCSRFSNTLFISCLFVLHLTRQIMFCCHCIHRGFYFNSARTSALIDASISFVVFVGFQPMDLERSARARELEPRNAPCSCSAKLRCGNKNTYTEIFLNFLLAEDGWHICATLAELDKNSSNFLADVIQAVFSIFAKIETFSAVAHRRRRRQNDVKEENVEFRH